MTLLDPTRESEDVRELRHNLQSNIIGQPQVIDSIMDVYSLSRAGMVLPTAPVGKFLFLGPTGSGKTHTVEALAQALVGNPRAYLKVDCAEFQHSHEIAKLIGSPPGYLGHRETPPMLSQLNLNKWHTATFKQSFLLFDEIEKGSDALWKLLLGILDKGTLTMGDNSIVDFTQTWIFMTSNLGAERIYASLEGANNLGFADAQQYAEGKLSDIAEREARKKFSPEFMNRLDRVVLFSPLSKESVDKIFDLEVKSFFNLSKTRGASVFPTFTPEARQFIIDRGYDPKNGARHLKRVLNKYLAFPIARFLLTGQVTHGDGVHVSLNGDALEFRRKDVDLIFKAA
jgi:ATP-dependent Clp protease ATP-binding subunit ClpA